MKRILFTFAVIAGMNAKAQTPMNLVEKSAHKLMSLVNKKQADPSFLTNTDSIKIDRSADGYILTLSAPSSDEKNPNQIVMAFDSVGVYLSAQTKFVSLSENPPLFPKPDAATLIDVGAEVVVDHLAENPDHPVVADQATEVTLTPENGDTHIAITLKDGRIYNIYLDENAKLVKEGF